MQVSGSAGNSSVNLHSVINFLCYLYRFDIASLSFGGTEDEQGIIKAAGEGLYPVTQFLYP